MAIDFSALARNTFPLANQGEAGLQKICELLKQNVPYYNWVGIYMMEDEAQMLNLGPYAGAATEHTRIPYGRGICGQVAVSGETFVVPDVWAESNYLACSLETKAEIVLPIYANGNLVAQLDIDSHFANPFTEADLTFLKELCEEIGQGWEAHK